MNLHTANNKFWETNNEFVSGGGDAGFKCVKSYTTLTDESVTTVEYDDGFGVGELTYNNWIDADIIYVTFNGSKYTCTKQVSDNANLYGGFPELGSEFNYPFAISSSLDGDYVDNVILTPTEGTYQIKIETEEETVETTPCFDKAVKSLANILTVRFSVTADPAVYQGDKTATEVKEVIESGGLVLFIFPPMPTFSTRVDIVNFIAAEQYINVQRGEDNDSPRYGINGNVIEAYLD